MKIQQIRMDDYPGERTPRDVWRLTSNPLRSLEPGEVSVALHTVSLDPGMKGWITNKRSYMPPVKPGAVMRAFGVGEVMESRAESLVPGDWVTGFTGVQTHGVYKATQLSKIDCSLASPETFLSGLGMTGYTGYFGMSDLGKPTASDTVVVSAASGAVGSIAAQVAKLAGARVIGIAGGPVKADYLTDTLGLDAAIDYKNEDVSARLRETCPDGIDLYFDNVGGDILSDVLGQMNYRGRVVVCGGISQYGGSMDVQGPSNFLSVVTHSLTIQGFTMRDYMHRVPEALEWLFGAWKSDQLFFREHLIHGIECFPDAFEMLFSGQNHGKLLLKVN